MDDYTKEKKAKCKKMIYFFERNLSDIDQEARRYGWAKVWNDNLAIWVARLEKINSIQL